MPYSELDLTASKYKPEIYLATPQKRIITKLYDAYNVNLIVKLGKINDLNFNIPYDVETMNDQYSFDIEQGIELTRSDVIDKIQDRFLVKFQFGEYVEWFIIRNQENIADEQKDDKAVKCFSLAYELKNIKIMQYNAVSYNVLEVLKGKPFDTIPGILKDSLWSVGHIDDELMDKYRAYECSVKNGIDIMIELSETFDFIPIYDTENRMINLYHVDNIGENKGLKFDYGKYLNTLNETIMSDDIITRLKAYGRDISIRRINPLGTDYIDDYSYFMHPYGTYDDDGYKITYSNYMSTELCEAINTHQAKIRERTPTFTTLIGKIELLNQIAIAKNAELRVMQNELKKLKDNLSVAKRAKSGGTTIQFFQQKIKEQEKLIESQRTNIEKIMDNMKIIGNQIDDIKDELAEKNNYTAELLEEKRLFTIEGDFIDTNIIEEHDLYKAAVSYFQEVNKPKTSISIDIIDFIDVLEEKENWDRLVLGDIMKVKYNKFNVDVNVRLVEINYDFESDNISLIITNVKDFTFTNDNDLLAMLIHRNTNIARAVVVSRPRWDRIDFLRQTLEDVLNNPWETLRLEDEIDWGTAIDLGALYDAIEQITLPEIDIPDYDDLFGDLAAYLDALFADLEFPEFEFEEADLDLLIDTYYEYILADWNAAGFQFYFVQQYEDEPAVQISFQKDEGYDGDFDTASFKPVAEHIRDGELYIGLKIYFEGSSVPTDFDGKVSVAAVCTGLDEYAGT